MAEPTVDVIVQIGARDVLAGRLWSHRRREHESATFAYDTEYLGRSDSYELDPALPLVAGPLQTPTGRQTFGAFSDCAPDRWGRRLIARTERQRVEAEGGAQRSFGEMDYLLGVRDDLRQGALRFRDPASATYLADEADSVPPLVALPKLLNAAGRLEREQASDDELRMLLRGGSSLGGARPKAHTVDRGGQPAIAKFPSPISDDWDVIRWEAVALALAHDAGIRVPDNELHRVDDKPVLIVVRFDRAGRQRIAYVSAMTMLEAKDGDRASYVDIAGVIETNSPNAGDDLRELWRRVAFSILISNTDDHLRNHGFLRTSSAGWSLSPAFDLNPDPRPGPKFLSTAIDRDDGAARLDPLLDLASLFGLHDQDARRVVGEVSAAISPWRSIAERLGLSRSDIAQLTPAFEHDQTDRARRLAAGEPIERGAGGL